MLDPPNKWLHKTFVARNFVIFENCLRKKTKEETCLDLSEDICFLLPHDVWTKNKSSDDVKVWDKSFNQVEVSSTVKL